MKENRGRDQFKKFKIILNVLSLLYRIFPKKIRVLLFNIHCGQKGKIGMAFRYAILKTVIKSMGDNVSIHPYVTLKGVANLELGNNVSIHSYGYIDATGGIFIGDDVSLGNGVSIISFEHNFEKLDVPIKDQGHTDKPVVIENNVYTGSKVTILGGITIGTGSIIGANAVVAKSIPEYSIAVGVPAKVIKTRK